MHQSRNKARNSNKVEAEDEILVKEVNIILAGEKRAGKSTFINAFPNFVGNDTLDNAVEDKEMVLLNNSNFVLTIDNLNETTKVFNGKESDVDEQDVNKKWEEYKYTADNTIITLIDTMSIEYVKEILNQMQADEYINAICFILNANSNELSSAFECYIKELLLNFPDLYKNFIFIFTHSRSTFYSPGDIAVPLANMFENILKEFPSIKIPFNTNNVICLDQDAFRFLVALKKGIKFHPDTKTDFASSWARSAKACKMLMNYIEYLKPYSVTATTSVQEAEDMIRGIETSLGKVVENIIQNIYVINKHLLAVADRNKTLMQLEKLLYIPVIKLDVLKLDEPRTVCENTGCSEITKTAGFEQISYIKLCHDICYLKECVPHITGDKGLSACISIGVDEFCKKCNHSIDDHVYIHYMTVLLEEKIDLRIDSRRQIRDILLELDKVEEILEKRKSEYQYEAKVIQKTVAIIHHFLKYSTNTNQGNIYINYIVALLTREMKGNNQNVDLVNIYKEFANTYNREKALLENDIPKVVTANDIKRIVNTLTTLKITGDIIEKFANIQKQINQIDFTNKVDKKIIDLKTSKRKRLLKKLF